MICTLRTQAGGWAIVATLRAEEFFERPTLQTLQVLEQAAEQAQVRPGDFFGTAEDAFRVAAGVYLLGE